MAMKEYPRLSVIRGDRRHLPDIVELEQRIFSQEGFPKSRLKYLLDSPNTAFFVAYQRGAPIAYGIALKNRMRNGKTKGRIYSLGVVRGLRSKGVGTLLLKTLETWLSAARVSFITLETKANKSGAKDFFASKGYQVVEFLPKYYDSADGLRMKKFVTAVPHTRFDRPRIPLTTS